MTAMVSFGYEAMVCIGIAAVDGLFADAAADRQRPGGCQLACVLPAWWRSSLHVDAVDDTDRFRYSDISVFCSVSIVEDGD